MLKELIISSLAIPTIVIPTIPSGDAGEVKSSSYSETVVRSEASGENAQVKTEVTNITNQNVTRVESNEPGEIRVENKNGEVKVESNIDSLKITTVPAESPEVKVEEEVKKAESILSSLWENLITRFQSIFHF